MFYDFSLSPHLKSIPGQQRNGCRCWVPSRHIWAVAFKKKPSSHLLPGYSEDGGAQRGEVIPEHEFAEGPVCLDDENEFPPVGNQSNWPNLRCLETRGRSRRTKISLCSEPCAPPPFLPPMYPCWTWVKSRQGVTSSSVRNPQLSDVWRRAERQQKRNVSFLPTNISEPISRLLRQDSHPSGPIIHIVRVFFYYYEIQTAHSNL